MKLAVNGGEPLIKDKFPPTNNIGVEETAAAVNEVMTSGVLSDFVARRGEYFLGGKRVKMLENAFCEKFGSKHTVSVNSASTALECAVAALSVTYGDEVIVPPYTMSATVTAVMLRGGVPVFADIDEKTFTLDPDSIKRKITPLTKAIITVNLFGNTSDMDAIMDIAHQYGLKVIEDNSQSPGGMHKGRFSGTISDIGVFSLNFHKTIHSGEGGVCLTNDDELAFRLQLARNHGDIVIDDYAPGEEERENYILGSNYRMSELHASIAFEQLKKLDWLNDRRIELADRLTDDMKQFACLTAPFRKEDVKHVYYVYAIKYDESAVGVSRDVFVKALRAEGVAAAPGYQKPIYRTPIFGKRTGKYSRIKMPFELSEYKNRQDYENERCPVCERMYEKELFYLSDCRYPLEKRHMDLIAEAIGKVLDNIDELNTSNQCR